MPKKRRARKRRAPRRNPSRRRAVVRRVRSGFAGLNFRSALKNVPYGVIGMFVTKWAAKRGSPDALESDPATWNGMTYLKGGLGAAGGAFIMNMIKPGSGQRVLEGGLMLLIYKAAQNHLIQKGGWALGQFGQAGGYMPGQVETNDAGEPFVLGADGQTWIPLDEGGGAELMGEYYGDALEEPGALGYGLGDALEEPGALGFGLPETANAYANALFKR